MSEITAPSNIRPLRGTGTAKSQIIAVGGGKGGVGKSFVSSSLAIMLGKLGFDTILVDLDIGSANLHTYLGEGGTRTNLHDFFKSPSSTILPNIIQTGLPNLRFMSGYNDRMDMNELEDAPRSALMSAIFNTPADYIILDLAAGNNQTTLDFFLMAQQQIVVLTPDPSSVENAYSFIKAGFFRKIKRFEEQLHLSSLITSIMDQRVSLGIRSPSQLINHLGLREPKSTQELKTLMDHLDVHLVLNQVRTYKEVDLGQSIRSVTAKYFGIPVSFLGYLEYDNAVWQALRKKRPLLLEFPHSRIYGQLINMAKELSNGRERRLAI